MRVGLTQRVEEVAARGERRDCLDQQWFVLLEALALTPVPIPNRLSDPVGWARRQGIEGLILTGGNDLAELPAASRPAPERDATETGLLEWAQTAQVPTLGVCRGLQMMHHYLGGALVPVEGHAGCRHRVEPSTSDALFDGYREVNSFHDWGLPAGALPSQLIASVTAPDGTVEAVRHGELAWIGIMWHPERERPFDEADIEIIRTLFGRNR